MALYLYKFNNYYNRIVKRFENLEDYGDPVSKVSNTNFNPNDEISTTHIVNFDGSECDYAINADGEGIISRWYIIEKVRLRAEQYRLTLYRDTLADYLSDILNSPIYLEKGWVKSIDDPAIYNLENFTANQIKKSETSLKDSTGCAWIVGYYDKDATDSEVNGPVNVDLEEFPHENLTGNLNSYDYYDYFNNDFKFPIRPEQNGVIKCYVGRRTDAAPHENYGILEYDSGGDAYLDMSGTASYPLKFSEYGGKANHYDLTYRWKLALEGIQSTENWMEDINKYIPSNSEADTLAFLNQRDKIIKTNDGEFYRIGLKFTGFKRYTATVGAGDLFNKLKNACSVATVGYSEGSWFSSGPMFENEPSNTSFQVEASAICYQLTYTRMYSMEATFDLHNTSGADGGGFIETQGCPYNIFAIPFGNITTKVKYEEADYELNIVKGDPFTALAIATGIQRKLQSKLYDIQLLPYFPMQQLIERYGVVKVQNTKQVGWVTISSDSFFYPIFSIPDSTFTIANLGVSIPRGTSTLQRKINNQCDKYRLCSPNYSNYFDFSAEANDGVDYFTVDCDYKPWTPYIHINPNFKGLYGQDFNDPRGLILGGDFSLTQVVDQWQTYQINNKNYQNIFDRQIQNMEVQHKYARQQDIGNAAVGTLGAALSGGMTGSLVGGPVGTFVGAGVSMLASGAAGALDVSINQKLRDEAKDYTIDLYNMQLQNIQALPTTIGKLSAFNPNNKIFPVLEYYSCTDVEKEAFRKKLLYNGMTIDRIGTLNDFITGTDHYYKGQLIRIDLNDDYHLINTIANELNKGVFI